jgi:predicted ABC-type ATPase
LSEQQYKNVFTDIISEYTQILKPVKKPIAIILGAQPGAGKTELERVARIELNENVMVCNPDNLRDYHPEAETIKQYHEQYYPDLTTEYAQAWKNELINYCLANRLNFIMETTFASGPDINRIIREMKDRDYRVEIKLLAVHPRLSLLGTQVRFEEMKAKEEAGRVVSKEVHDDRYAKLIPTLYLVQSEGLYDKIQIYGRNVAATGHHLVDGVALVADQPANPFEAFSEEIDKRWTKKLYAYFAEKMNQVINLKQLRGAPEHEVERFKKEIRMRYIPPRKFLAQLQQQMDELSSRQKHDRDPGYFRNF